MCSCVLGVLDEHLKIYEKDKISWMKSCKNTRLSVIWTNLGKKHLRFGGFDGKEIWYLRGFLECSWGGSWKNERKWLSVIFILSGVRGQKLRVFVRKFQIFGVPRLTLNTTTLNLYFLIFGSLDEYYLKYSNGLKSGQKYFGINLANFFDVLNYDIKTNRNFGLSQPFSQTTRVSNTS